MKRFTLGLCLCALLNGCGSGGLTDPVTGQMLDGNNFISTTIEVENQFLYLLNAQDNTVSGFAPLVEEEEEHSHSHAHGRILAQEEEEDGEEYAEVAGSPFSLSTTQLVDLAVLEDSGFLVLLDQNGTVKTYLVDALSGEPRFLSQRETGVLNPRRLVADGSNIAVLGDRVAIHAVGTDGTFSAPAFVDDTTDWVDLKLNGEVGAASTDSGAIGFQWVGPGAIIPSTVLTLPGATRGELVYAAEGLYVVNSADASVSRLAQSPNGELVLEDTFELPAGLVEPFLITTLFEGEDLLLADQDSASLLHPEDEELEDEGEVTLSAVPTRLFAQAEAPVVLVGLVGTEGTDIIHIEDDVLELHEERGPGGLQVTGMGLLETVGTVTIRQDN